MKIAKLLLLTALIMGCNQDDTPTTTVDVLIGEGIGDIEIGMNYSDLVAAVGEPTSPTIQNRMGVIYFPDLGIEALMISPERSSLSDDALVLAVGARATAGVLFEGVPRPGLSREEVEASLGESTETIGNFVYYPSGVSLEYQDSEGEDTVRSVGVFAPYEYAPEPPPMSHAGGTP